MAITIKIADKAINATYTNVTGATSGSGTGAKFTVVKEDGDYTVNCTTAGTGYAAGDTITLLGTGLGGTIANNLIVTVATVGTGGAIATFGDVGTGRVGDGVIDVLIGISGTPGVDTYVFDGDSTDYTVEYNDGDIIATSTLANVEFTLAGHERVTFNDKSIAFDLVDGADAGEVYSLLGAALGVSDITPELMGAGLHLKELGWTNKQIAEQILNTETYKLDAGGISNETFAKHVWKNVFGVNGSYQDIQDVVYVIEHYGYSQADVLLVGAHRAEFQATIDLVGLQATGVEYTPYVA